MKKFLLLFFISFLLYCLTHVSHFFLNFKCIYSSLPLFITSSPPIKLKIKFINKKQNAYKKIRVFFFLMSVCVCFVCIIKRWIKKEFINKFQRFFYFYFPSWIFSLINPLTNYFCSYYWLANFCLKYKEISSSYPLS